MALGTQLGSAAWGLVVQRPAEPELSVSLGLAAWDLPGRTGSQSGGRVGAAGPTGSPQGARVPLWAQGPVSAPLTALAFSVSSSVRRGDRVSMGGPLGGPSESAWKQILPRHRLPRTAEP